MLLILTATACAGVFFGAALYINLVEHPARVSCGTELAVREFTPSYHRATVMQASLAVVGCLSGFSGAWITGDARVALAAALLGAVVPITLLVIFPTNAQLLDPSLDRGSVRTAALLSRWNRLHAIRTVLSGSAFAVFLWRLSGAI